MSNLTAITSSQWDYLYTRFGKNVLLKPMQEEASTRRYFQIISEPNTPVLCIDSQINSDFIYLSEFLLKNGFDVPRIIDVNENENLILQSFLGSNDLSTLSLPEYRNFFPKILNLIDRYQSLSPPPLVQKRIFDTEKFTFELNLTLEKFSALRNVFGLKTEISDESKAFLEETNGYLATYEPKVFTHRDFHCRNLILTQNGGIGLIDFQDARMGIPQYDLVSILFDSYFPLPRDFRDQQRILFRKTNLDQSKKYTEAFFLQALQRTFKALGTYFRMIVDHKNTKFKNSILNCLDLMEEIIQQGMFSDSLYIWCVSLKSELKGNIAFQTL